VPQLAPSHSHASAAAVFANVAISSSTAGGAVTAATNEGSSISSGFDSYVSRVLEVRALHCEIGWNKIRSESLETTLLGQSDNIGENDGDAISIRRRKWLGYANEQEESEAHETRRREALARGDTVLRDVGDKLMYSDLSSVSSPIDAMNRKTDTNESRSDRDCKDDNCDWKKYWESQT
jgi:hypothetical protein